MTDVAIVGAGMALEALDSKYEEAVAGALESGTRAAQQILRDR